jgi:hypothetical protein
MSSTTDAIADAVTGRDPTAKREVLDPFGDGPATLLDAANELTRGYMRHERDPYHRLDNHHGEWLRLLNDERKLVLNCHRDGLKTTIVLAYLALRLEYDAGYQAIWAMNNQDMAVEKANSEFNKIVERNPWLVELNKERRRDTAKKKEFAKGSSLRATYLDGGIDGERAHLLVMDDLIKARGDGSPKDVREWVEGTALPMVKDNGRTVFIGTRKRRDDIYQHYRSLPAYSVAEYPAILDVWEQEHGEADDADARRPPREHYTEVDGQQILWPEGRGTEWLADKRSEMSDYRFYREYSLSFIGGEGNLVSKADIDRPVDNGGCSIRGSEPPQEITPSAGSATVVAHDPAQSPTGDDAAFVALHVERDGRRALIDAVAQQGMKPSQVKATLADLDDRYDPAVIVIEDNGMQQYVANDAIEMSPSMRAKVTGISTTGQKHSWENGIPRLRRLVETGAIQFYRGHGGTEAFIQAALSLTLDDGRLEGHTPDLIAAWYMAEQGIRHLEDVGALEDPPDANEEGETPNGVSYL